MAIECQKNSRSTSQTDRNPTEFNGRMGLLIEWKEYEVMCKHILNQKSLLNLKRVQEVQAKSVVAQVSQTDRFALYLGIRLNLMLEWDS
ncbi:uncharacterized protein G2W53_022143 [Senna tora]|uniref:Uncharacterized protein n=1 Tax=Senna tora TaxID=362788 RepID=A0A834WNX6_9FABA|nr:uncharacterized protein G2W53_022143 [Senna tora]